MDEDERADASTTSVDVVLLWATRVGAWASAVVGCFWFGELYSGVFEDGIWPVLICYAVAGAIIGLRALPTGSAVDRLTSQGLDPVMKPRLRVSGIDIAVILAIAVVGGLLSRPDEWWAPVLAVLLLVIPIGIGLIAGMVVLMPLGLLAQLLVRVLSGRRVALATAVFAALFLEVAAFAVLGVLAVDLPSGGGWRGRAWTGIFVVLTGIPIGDARIISEPLAWAARGVALLLVASVVYLVTRRVRTNAARRRERHDLESR